MVDKVDSDTDNIVDDVIYHGTDNVPDEVVDHGPSYIVDEVVDHGYRIGDILPAVAPTGLSRRAAPGRGRELLAADLS